MSEYIGRINVSKDTMLHVTNNIFNKNIKESTTKENILKIIPQIYVGENLKQLIKMLPYESYLTLKELMEYTKNNNDINEFEKQIDHKGIYYLEEAMIVIMRAKYDTYNYSLNSGILENLQPLFNNENRELAERYSKIENLTKGILYSYGIVEFNFLRKTICKYMKEIITQEDLEDFYFTRLNLNIFVNYEKIEWTGSNETELYATYIDEERNLIDSTDIAAEQKGRGLRYKEFTEKEILNRDEFLWDKSTQDFFNFIKSKNKEIWDFQFQRIIKDNEFGRDILNRLIEKYEFEEDVEIEEFMQRFMSWYNNSPQYILGGYSPVEYGKFNIQ